MNDLNLKEMKKDSDPEIAEMAAMELEETKEKIVVEEKAELSAVEKEMETLQLTDAEKKMVADFSSKIDLRNTNLVLQYGAGAQKKIADFSETALNSVRTKDMGEVGQMLTDVVAQLKDFVNIFSFKFYFLFLILSSSR